MQTGNSCGKDTMMLHTELLGCADGKKTFYVETKDKGEPLSSNDFIRHTFSKLAPDEEIGLSKRDDERNSIVITVSSLLTDKVVEQFFDRIGSMSGC